MASVRTDDLFSVAVKCQARWTLSPPYTRPITAGHRASPSNADITHLRRRRPLSEGCERVRNYNDGRNERSRKIRRHAYAYIAGRLCNVGQLDLIYRFAISMHTVSVSSWTLAAHVSINMNYWLVLRGKCVGIRASLKSVTKVILKKKMREREEIFKVLKFWT